MTNRALTTKARVRRQRLAIAGVLALALVTAIGMTFGASADAKKKKKGPSVYQATQSPNAAIPNNPPTGPSTPFVSTFTVGKKFKGKTVGDVNVTGITTTGSGPGAADDLGFRITGPSGRSVTLIKPGIGDQNIGPLTLDDDTPVSICDSDPSNPCRYYTQQLNRPFAGTANLAFLGTAGTGPLAAFDGQSMRGNWLLTVWDQGPGGTGTTSVLNSWGLKITAERPVK